MTVDRDDATTGEAISGRSRGPALSFGPLATALWGYRRAIAVIGGALIATCALTLALAVLLLPIERIGAIEFRLTFDGAAAGTYPNGSPFNYSELVSTPVLTDVFERDDLAQFGTFSDFKDQLYVLQSNPEIDLLDHEYESKLSDPRLSPVDRAKLEDEYRKKRTTLFAPQYKLNYRRTAAFKTIPSTLMAKVLQDVLTIWAQQAVERRGVLQYDIPVVSRNAIQPETIQKDDYIVGADLLRAHALRLINSLNRIMALPGATLIRSKSGGLTPVEVRANVEDVLRFKVQPLIELIRATGLAKDPLGPDLYCSSQLMYAKLKRDEAAKRALAYDEPLRAYSGASRDVGIGTTDRSGRTVAPGDAQTLMPQLSETFLNQVVTLAKQADDVDFRQGLTKKLIAENLARTDLDREVAYYEELQKNTARWPVPAGTRDAVIQRMTAQALDALNDLNVAADQILDLFKETSARNLSPEVGLFTPTAPFSLESLPALPFKRASLIFMVAVLLIIVVVPGACLLHFYTRRSS